MIDRSPVAVLTGLMDSFIDGTINLSEFTLAFRNYYLDELDPECILPDIEQLLFDRILETFEDIGGRGERLHDDPRLENESTYREYLRALMSRYRSGSLTWESPEY